MADSVNKSFFDALLDAKAAKWSAGVAFDRSNPLPLDQWSVFKDRASAEAYLTNAKAYPGQVIAYTEADIKEGETLKKAGGMVACVLSSNAAGTGLELKQIGISPDGETLTVNAEGAMALYGSSTAANGTLPMLEDGKLVWKTLEDIGAGDGNDDTTYEFAFANQKITITPKFNGVAQTAQELDLSVFVTADELAAEIAKIPEDTNTEYHLEYDSDKKEIKLAVGKNDGKMVIDATPFIKDGMLHDVDYDADKKELVFVWNTDAGSKEDRVPVEGLIDVYTAGNGLDLTGNKFSIKLDSEGESFLTVGENGLKLAGVQAAIDAAKKDAIDDAASKYYGKSEVYTKSEADTKIDEKIASVTGGESAADVKLALESYRDAINAEIWGDVAGTWTTTKTVDGKTVVTYTPSYGTESRIDKLEKVGAQANVIEEIKVNGTKVNPTDKSVDIAVPTDVKDLSDADNKYVTTVRMREAEGYTPALQVNKTGSEAVIDDSALQATIKNLSDTAVQSGEFAGKAMSKDGTKLSISQADAREALGLKSAAYKDESAFAPAGDYKTKQTEKNGTLTGAQVVDTWSQNANGEMAVTTRNLTPADIGAQPAGNYQAAGDYKVKQSAVADPTATKYEGSVLSYIETLSQNENGEISATKRSFDMAAYIEKVIGDSTNIMNFRGVVTPSEAGFAADVAVITSPQNGDVILYGEYEYIYNGTKWEQFGDATGAIATAKAYTDAEIAKIHGVDDDTIKLNNNKAYVAKVSTDVLVQGTEELILRGGNAFGYDS